MTRNPTAQLPSLTDPIKVALVTEDPVLRNGLSSALATSSSIEVVELAGAEVALADARTTVPRSIAVPIVAVVGDPTHAASALAAGARGVVLDSQLGADLPAALAAVRSGLTVIDSALTSALMAAPHPAPVAPAPSPAIKRGRGELTDRERQVVQLLSEGLSNKLIADRLGISDHTAKFHVNGVMIKLGASTRTEAVVEAMRRGLVTL